MKFEYKEVVEHPLDRVYRVLRDEMTGLPKFLPGIDSIVELEREVLDEIRLRVVSEWQGNATSSPKAVRPFVTETMTRWRDYALWDNERTLVEWRFETTHFESLYTCSGVNYFEALGPNQTQLRLTGDLVVYPERVPGVPKLFAKRLSPKVEAFLIDMVTPNLAQMPRAIQAFLDQEDAL